MNLARLSVLSASLTIAACGGSGDFGDIAGGGGFGGGGTSTTTYAITAANAPTATRASWEAANGSSSFGSAGGQVVSTGSPGDFAKASPAKRSLGHIANVLQKIPFGPEVSPCLVDGAVTLSGDIADPLTLTTGDTFKIVFEACDDGFGEVIDGTIDMTVREFTGDLLVGTYQLSIDTVTTDLQVFTASDTITSNGDATVTEDTTRTPFIESGVSGSSMTVDYNGMSETLSNYSSSQTIDGGLQPLPYTLSAAGTLDSTELDGVIQYSTPVTFAGEGLDYPSSGSMLVTGLDSAARLTALDSVNVTIDVDIDGDGTYDETIETTWAELLGAAT